MERVEVASSRLPAGFDGFRVAMFSDVHTGLLLGRDRVLRRMVDIINALDADVVVNCGDIVNYDYRELDGRVLEILSGIRSRDGVYAVLGNHDLGIYIRDTVAYPPQENVRAHRGGAAFVGLDGAEGQLRDTCTRRRFHRSDGAVVSGRARTSES